MNIAEQDGVIAGPAGAFLPHHEAGFEQFDLLNVGANGQLAHLAAHAPHGVAPEDDFGKQLEIIGDAANGHGVAETTSIHFIPQPVFGRIQRPPVRRLPHVHHDIGVAPFRRPCAGDHAVRFHHLQIRGRQGNGVFTDKHGLNLQQLLWIRFRSDICPHHVMAHAGILVNGFPEGSPPSYHEFVTIFGAGLLFEIIPNQQVEHNLVVGDVDRIPINEHGGGRVGAVIGVVQVFGNDVDGVAGDLLRAPVVVGEIAPINVFKIVGVDPALPLYFSVFGGLEHGGERKTASTGACRRGGRRSRSLGRRRGRWGRGGGRSLLRIGRLRRLRLAGIDGGFRAVRCIR